MNTIERTSEARSEYILLVSGNQECHNYIRQVIHDAGLPGELIVMDDITQIADFLTNVSSCGLCIVEQVVGQHTALDLLGSLHQSQISIPVIVSTEGDDAAFAESALSSGALDVVARNDGAKGRLGDAMRLAIRFQQMRKASRTDAGSVSQKQDETVNAYEALRRSEESYRIVAETALEAIMTVDEQGQIHFANPATRAIFEVEDEAVKDANITEFLPGFFSRIRPCCPQPEHDGSLPASYCGAATLTGVTGKGNSIHVEISATCYTQDEQRLFTVIARDTTQREALQRERDELLITTRAQREWLSAIVESVPGIVWESVIDPLNGEERITFVSEYTEQMLGYSPRDWMERPDLWKELIHPEDRARVFEQAAVLQEQGEGEFIYRMVTRDGDIIWCDVRMIAVRDAEGRQIGNRGIALDITSQRTSDLIHRNSEERFRRIVETCREGICIIGNSGDILLANHRLAEILKCSVEEVVGEHVFKFIHPDDRTILSVQIERRKQGFSDSYDLRLCAVDGTMVWTIVSGSPFFDTDNEYAGSLAMITDITARKLAEEGLRKTQDQLEHHIQERTEELTRTLALLEATYSAQRRFIADASHDLRTPLTVIRSEIDMLMQHQGHDRLTLESLGRVSTQARRLDRLTTDLLLLATLDAGVYDNNRHSVAVRVDEMVLESITKFDELIRQKNIVWNIQFDDVLESWCQKVMMEQAFYRVLENAVKYSSHGDIITITLSQDAEMARITVSDQGPGVSANDRPRVFDRFYRGDGARRTPGTGLGLSIAQAVIKAYGGSITLNPEYVSGTEVIILLPLYKGQQESSDSSSGS